MRVLVISTSLRPGSFSEKLATSFTEGARSAGHDVEFVSLKGKPLRFCTGCVRCQTTKKCMLSDAAPAIVEKIRLCDAVVWVTPIYYYSMSGQMKVLLDRSNPLYVSQYNLKDVYVLAIDFVCLVHGPLHTHAETTVFCNVDLRHLFFFSASHSALSSL